MKITKSTYIPLSFVSVIVLGGISWGSLNKDVSTQKERLDHHEEIIEKNRDQMQSIRNELMAQMLILRQDVSEIKGEIKKGR